MKEECRLILGSGLDLNAAAAMNSFVIIGRDLENGNSEGKPRKQRKMGLCAPNKPVMSG